MEIKYDNHSEEWAEIASDELRLRKAEQWLNKESLDSWRHDRIRSCLDPFIDYSKRLSWLTIGDGRFGTDANYLITKGAANVVATDISEELLKIGKEKKFINNYSIQNAEKINYSDEEFDYVYCKEAYHHCPRAPLAFYEMIRVAKFALILSEPSDGADSTFPSLFKGLFKKYKYTHSFESIGNYVYCINRKEIEKMMLGIGLKHYAYLEVNDYYIFGIESINFKTRSIYEHFIKIKLIGVIFLKNILTFSRIKGPNILTVAIFKGDPPVDLKNKLLQVGFKFEILPNNPYINSI
jgi:SAM-dependent methyltransferase